MKILDYLTRDTITYNFAVTSKEEFFKEAVLKIIDKNHNFNKEEVLNLFLLREKTLSTGVGNHIAIPHIMYEKCESQQIYVFKLKTPIEFQSLDNRPVAIILMLIGSTKSPPSFHMRVLAKLGLLLKKEMFLDDLMHAQNSNDLYEVIKKYD